MDKPVVRNRFKAPEGRYELQSERTSGLVNFNPLKAPRLTQAILSTGSEQGVWILANVGDCLLVFKLNATDKEPYKSVNFGQAQVRGSHPTCHSFQANKDGADMLVGLGTGEVVLLSLRAILQHQAVLMKPSILATFNAEGAQDSSRCNAVAWLPKQDCNIFAAAFQSGVIYLYKKSNNMSTEGSSKFSLSSLSSSGKSLNPLSNIIPNAGLVHDVAFSPDGTRLAVACRDGGLRIYEAPQGSKDSWQLTHGLQSYYGAQLCCCWSQDGRYIAGGGEDDQVMVYGLAEKCMLAWGEGHTSWVSRVAFDPWASNLGPPSVSESSGVVPNERLYRLGSVGQDAQLCFWDLVVFDDNTWQPLQTASSSPTAQTAGRKGGGLGFPHGSTSAFGGSMERAADSGSGSSKGSWSKGNGVTVAVPSVPRSEMSIIPPVMQHRVHVEPVSDILFREDVFYTICYSGALKCWRRPGLAGSHEPQPGL